MVFIGSFFLHSFMNLFLFSQNQIDLDQLKPVDPIIVWGVNGFQVWDKCSQYRVPVSFAAAGNGPSNVR